MAFIHCECIRYPPAAVSTRAVSYCMFQEIMAVLPMGSTLMATHRSQMMGSTKKGMQLSKVRLMMGVIQLHWKPFFDSLLQMAI